MIKYKKLPANIEDLMPEAIACLQARADIHFAYLFGSFGKGKPLPLSDIDIAVYIKEPFDAQEKKMEIFGVLADILHTDEIDLIILNNASLTLRMKILESKKLIVDHSPSLRQQYESLTIREYFDFSIKEKAILERRFLHG